jgi:hypothetical protein
MKKHLIPRTDLGHAAGTTFQYDANDARFFVKNYNVSGNPFEPQNLDGVEAQGNDDPWSRFIDHALVEYNGHLFDPSYGIGPFSSLADWEDSSIEAFGGLVQVTTNQALVALEWIWKADSKGSAELRPDPNNSNY